MPSDPLVITKHAIRRYMERIRPGADEREAFLVLKDAATRWKHAGRSLYGQTVWTVDKPDMRLITRHNPVEGMILVTVLGPEESAEDEERELQARREALKSRSGKRRSAA